jgi:deazaflavin-dependent oxidoreductase (nitroreductase family)
MPQTSYIRWVPAPGTIKLIDKIHTFLYACTRGLVGGRVDGLDILLLTTLGRKTGLARSVPLPYFASGAGYVLVASFGGNPKNPHWFHNILANPEVGVQQGRRSWTTRAHVPEAEERERLWAELTHEFPRYQVYQTRTSRQIPLVVIDPPPPL